MMKSFLALLVAALAMYTSQAFTGHTPVFGAGTTKVRRQLKNSLSPVYRRGIHGAELIATLVQSMKSRHIQHFLNWARISFISRLCSTESHLAFFVFDFRSTVRIVLVLS
jgi:hypothetical protein